MTSRFPSRRGMMLGAAGLAALGACSRVEAPLDEQGRVRLRVAAGVAAGPDQGGFFQAIASGAYEQRGLNVEILSGNAGTDIPGLLAASAVELAIAPDSFTVLGLISERAPVKAAAAFFQKDAQVLLLHPDDEPATFADLTDRPILMDEATFAGLWPWLRARFGLRADQVRRGDDASIEAFIADESAILIGRLTSDPTRVQTTQGGFRPRMLMPADEGFAAYGGLVVAPNAFARDNANALRDFIAASVEGWRAYIHGDASQADALIRRANPALTQTALDAARDDLRSNAVVDGGDAALYGLGAMTAERWQAFSEQSSGAFTGTVDWREAFTTQYLPGRG